MGRILAWSLAIVSLLVIAFVFGKARWKRHQSALLAEAGAAAKGPAKFVRVEDLPPARFVRVDELPPAKLVAVRPLQGRELTPDLIRKADDMLRRQQQPLGTQVVLETRDKTYIARFEWHYTYDQSPERRQIWHKGITLYATE